MLEASMTLRHSQIVCMSRCAVGSPIWRSTAYTTNNGAQFAGDSPSQSLYARINRLGSYRRPGFQEVCCPLTAHCPRCHLGLVNISIQTTGALYVHELQTMRPVQQRARADLLYSRLCWYDVANTIHDRHCNYSLHYCHPLFVFRSVACKPSTS